LLLQSRAGQLKSELQDSIDCISEFTEDDQTRARWLAKGRNSLEIKCSPFDSAEKARKHLWPLISRAVLTSATLTSLGSFDSMRAGLGLPPDTPTLKLDSPLDYSHAKLIVPNLSVDGNHSSHAAMVRAFLMDYAVRSEKMGILVYFTNKKQMLDVYNSLTPIEQGLILLQGQWQPSAMIEEHKRRIDDGKRSILFGLDSLSEGVDLPGSYCTRVLVTKLPFPSPNDPVMATHAEYLTSNGMEPFHILTLPKAGLKFAQVAGRLIRREGDSGDVVVLDRRLCSKTYGKQMVRGTPFKAIARN
jgi:ATP-dependent DNA helicase DinG